MQLVLVLNEVRGDRFDILEASGLRTRAEDLGARIINLRHMQDTTIQKIDAHNTSFWAAANLPDAAGNGLGLMERQRVKIWLNRTYKAFDQVQV